MTWANEAELKRALETLKERYPGAAIEIITTFDIAHSGWECDSQGALILRDRNPELVIVDQVGVDNGKVREILEAKVEEYERLATETRNVLAQHMALEGLEQAHPHPPDLDRRHIDNMRNRGLKSSLDDENNDPGDAT